MWRYSRIGQYNTDRIDSAHLGALFPLLRLPIIFFPLSFPHKDVIVSRPTSSLNLNQLTIHLPVSFLLFTTFSLCSSWLSSVLTRNSLTSAGKPILMPSSALHDSNPPLGIHPLPAPLVPLEMTWYEHSFSCLAPCGGAQPALVLTRLISMRGSWITDLSFLFAVPLASDYHGSCKLFTSGGPWGPDGPLRSPEIDDCTRDTN